MPYVKPEEVFDLLPFSNLSHENACLSMMWSNIVEVSRALGDSMDMTGGYVLFWHSDICPNVFAVVLPHGGRSVHVHCVEPRKAFDDLRLVYDTMIDLAIRDGSAAWLPDFALRDAVFSLGWADKLEPSLVCLGDSEEPCVGVFAARG